MKIVSSAGAVILTGGSRSVSTPRNISTSASFSPQITQGLIGDRSGDKPATNRLSHDTVVFKLQINLIYISILISYRAVNVFRLGYKNYLLNVL